MPKVEVWVDTFDMLDEISDDTLLDLLRERGLERPVVCTGDAASLCDEIRTAFYARNAARLEAVLMHIEAPPLRIPKDGVARMRADA